MIIPLAALVVLLLPLALGGDPRRLAGVRLHHVGWVTAALAVQILIVEILTGPDELLDLAHISTYVVALWFVLVNRRIPGLPVIGLGAILNGVTITVNGGTLPARAGAMRAAGIDPDTTGFVNSGTVAHPHLAWFGDIFAIPTPLPLANVFSIGDLLIILGTGYAAGRIMGTRWTAPWSPVDDAVTPDPAEASAPSTR